MAEVKNSFLRSKMNKDLDDRLIPNGEYRDATNISVGKSENDDIGALETVLGNTIIPATVFSSFSNLEIIGNLVDKSNNTVYVFATDYTDNNATFTRPASNSGKKCIIYSWSNKTPGTITTLIDDLFLNFSTTNPIQATLIEDLLFFTDNRNQPRKISVDKGAGYYTGEDQISVAKYNPYQTISLVKKETGIVSAITSSTVFTLSTANSNIKVGMSVVSSSKTGNPKIQGDEFITVTDVNGAIITISSGPSSGANNPAVDDNFVFLTSTMTNKSAEPNWPGDPDYLESKFVRFSYRFRFDDGEYSLMAPFTQIAYIPKQQGYFFNGDEDAAFRSTVLQWMENNVDNVELLIPLPDNASSLLTSYKIQSMDVLYKESDALVVKVLETLSISDINNKSVNNTCIYNYQSRKPYKTLTQDQTVRVYDKVPVRALAQETAGNRIIYGNFHDVYTPPSNIDYTVRSIEKTTITSDSWVEYPNHSLKQNRNYQVGFVLADKYGRQSSVILSPVTLTSTNQELGSTIFSPYYRAADNLNIKNWFGDTLQVVVNEPGIQSNQAGDSQPNFSTGEPGLYAIRTGTGKGFMISDTAGDEATIIGNVYQFKLSGSAGINNVIPEITNYLRGEFTDYVYVSNVQPNTPSAGIYRVTTTGQINSSYLNNFQNASDIKWAYNINPTGWYSYKVVVKQTQQDYYNVYLPGILNGYPDQTGATATPIVPFPTGEDDKTANIVLINDNINKVPRDLSEVGPDQKQFRSSVQLFGRVTNVLTASTPPAATDTQNNIQYYPGISTDTAISIATSNDSNMEFDNLSTEGQANLYQIDSKPLIARLATSSSIGVTSTTSVNTNMAPFLAIYETEPDESLLDIFWETATVGMISDLNEDVSTGFEGPTSFNFDFSSFQENVAPGSAITDLVWPTTNEGGVFDLNNPSTATMSVTDGSDNVVNYFTLYQELAAGADQYKYQIKTASNKFFTYKNNSAVLDDYTFAITVTPTATPANANTISISGTLINKDPLFDPALSLITKTVDQTVISPKLTAFNGTNASNNTAEKESELEWTITAGNPTNTVNGQPAFQLNATTGELTQTPNNTPNGLYNLTITLKDAVSSGTQGAGGRTITGSQSIRIGPTPTNSGVASFCKDRVNDASAQYPNQASIAPYQSAGGSITAVWYLSNNTSSGTTRETYLKGTGWPSGCEPTNASTGAYTNSTYTDCYTIHRLGNALTQGTVALSMNMQLNYTSGVNPPSGIEGTIDSWRVYHRTNNTQAWAVIADINNHTIRAAGIQRGAGQAVRLQTFSQTDSYYLQYVMAYNTPGEYLIVAKDMTTTISQTADQALIAYCNSSDLNYASCVIDDGTNVSPSATTYQYGMSGTSSTGNTCSFGTNTAYSNVPYGQYVNQFFQTSSLTNPYNFTTDATDGNGVTHTNYLSYRMKQASPYNEGGVNYKYSFSARFTTGTGLAGKVYNPPSWGTDSYIYNCGNLANAQSQKNALALTFPYTVDTTTIS